MLLVILILSIKEISIECMPATHHARNEVLKEEAIIMKYIRALRKQYLDILSCA